MSQRVVVSGYGIISALGFNAEDTLYALKEQRTGIGPAKHLPTNHAEMVVGEVDATNEQLATKAGTHTRIISSRTALLGLIAAQEAIRSAGLEDVDHAGMALVSGTSVGGMDITERAYASVLRDQPVDYVASFNGHDCGHSTQVMARQLGVKGYLGTISTACSSSANTIMHAARLIKSGQADCVIAGGTDALSVFTLNGFNSLKILDSNWCKPFDLERQGLNLGEGAAFLVLESEEHLANRKGKARALLTGYGNANDAFHQTASSPEGVGALKAMQDAFSVANISKDKIGYINAHGTGTANNDESESLALKNLFEGHDVPPYSSTKAFTGHTLGASGAIEAVFSIMALEQQALLPCLNISKPLDWIGKPVMEYKTGKIEAVLSNSFGFGGNCSSLIFQAI